MINQVFNGKALVLLLLLIMIQLTVLLASNLEISEFTIVDNDEVAQTLRLQFTIAWENSWRDAMNYHAVCIFMNYSDGTQPWGHYRKNYC